MSERPEEPPITPVLIQRGPAGFTTRQGFGIGAALMAVLLVALVVGYLGLTLPRPKAPTKQHVDLGASYMQIAEGYVVKALQAQSVPYSGLEAKVVSVKRDEAKVLVTVTLITGKAQPGLLKIVVTLTKSLWTPTALRVSK